MTAALFKAATANKIGFILVQYNVRDFHIEFLLSDEICPCVVAIGHCGFNGGICGHCSVSVQF